jgi:hypothetical protein
MTRERWADAERGDEEEEAGAGNPNAWGVGNFEIINYYRIHH